LSDFEQYGTPPLDLSWFVRPNGYDASKTIHGAGHTRRVWIHAMALAEELDLEPWQREAVHYAAMWHDIGRTHDGVDYYHGAKSAGKAVALGLHVGLGDRAREVALFSVTHHCGDEDHAERAARVRYFACNGDGTYSEAWVQEERSLEVFRVLKDADALDRVRLGDLDPSYLRFPQSLARIKIAWELLAASEY
jgi:hypothetical protein